MRNFRLLGFFFFLVFAGSVAWPIPAPGFNLPELVKAADLVVVGKIVDVHEVSRVTMTIRNIEQEYQVMQAQIRPARVLKGTVPDALITVRFLLPMRYPIGYRGLNQSEFRLIMLIASKSNPSEYELTSPYYPSQAAISDPPARYDSALASVIAEMSSAIASPAADWSARRQAMFNLMSVTDPTVTHALEAAVTDKDNRVNIFAAAFLLLRDDMAGLDRAARALNSELKSLRDDDRSTLLAGISRGIHNPQAIPFLQKLLSSPDAEVRAIAAHGLGTIGLRSTQELLLPLLRDPESSVRFAAATALADVTGNVQWKPQSFQDFQQNQQRYLSYWDK